jgi:hypothetical protein
VRPSGRSVEFSRSGRSRDTGPTQAACRLANVPVMIAYNGFLDRFIGGYPVGAVK